MHYAYHSCGQQYPQAKVGLCVEQPAGAILPFLEAYAWITLHAINPLTLQKYREAFVTSRAKDDAKDARYQAELLWHHHAELPVWQPEDSATRKLQLLVSHPDREIFRNLPGAGPTLAPRLLASVGAQRELFANAAALQHYSRIAPVTKQSGGKRHVHRRYLCPKLLRQGFHEYAKESILHSRWAAAYYQQQREKGSPHHTAVRALAFKWQRIIFRLWQDKTVYREEIYEAALRKTGTALVARFDHIEVGKSPFKNPTKKI